MIEINTILDLQGEDFRAQFPVVGQQSEKYRQEFQFIS
jgi:hypothetical protein